MPDEQAQIEEAATDENTWVRARILKQDPPVEGSLLQIAERARDMAARSLGTAHPAYAVALQNLGLYYETAEDDRAKAAAYFTQARAVVNEADYPLAYGWQRLGIFYLEVHGDPARAEDALAQALAIERRATRKDDLQLAETLFALAWVKATANDLDAAIKLAEEALQIRRANLPADDPAIEKIEHLLAMLQADADDTSAKGVS